MFHCYLDYPYKGLHTPLLPLHTEHLCLYVSVLQNEVEGAQRVAGLWLAAPTITINWELPVIRAGCC